MRLVTAASLAANVISLVGALVVVRRKGFGAVARAIRPPAPQPINYTQVAHERFADLPGAPLVVMGDSQAQGCPAGELFGHAAVRGIGGQVIADVHGWLNLVLADPALRRLVVWAGTNDVGLGRGADRIFADMFALLSDAQITRPDVQVVVLGVPPLTAHPVEVAEANRALAKAAAGAGATFVDVAPVLTGYLAPDGTHITARGYGRLRALAGQIAG